MFRASPDINVILAPWDEFGRGASVATTEAQWQNQVKFYSVDASTSNIEAMCEPNSL